MATLYYEKDADPSLIQGPQGRHHRLRVPGARPRPEPLRVRRRRARRAPRGILQPGEGRAEAGLRVMSVDQAATEADVIMILLPDTEQSPVYEAEIAPHLTQGDASSSPTASTSASA